MKPKPKAGCISEAIVYLDTQHRKAAISELITSTERSIQVLTNLTREHSRTEDAGSDNATLMAMLGTLRQAYTLKAGLSDLLADLGSPNPQGNSPSV